MALLKKAFVSLFLSSFILYTIAFIYSLNTIAKNSWALNQITYPHVLSGFCCLTWAILSLWALFDISPENQKKRISILPGLMAIFSSFGLTYLRLPHSSFALITFTLTVFTIAILYSRLTAVIMNIIAGVSHTVILYMHGEAYLAQAVLLVDFLSIVAVICIGSMLIEWRKKIDMFDQARWAASEFASANIRLQDSMNVSEITTREDERTRVAREIHDTVGYALTSVLVQVNVIRKLLKVNPSELKNRLNVVEEMIRAAIRDVRSEVSKLREDISVQEESWRTKWLRLCENFAKCTGVRIPTNITKDLEPIDDLKGEIIYRIIQEALTNSYRHGSSSIVDIVIGWEEKEREIYLRISDNGAGSAQPKTGNGLNGIRERVHSVGGQTAWQTKPYAGFDIGVVMPWEGE